MAAPGWELTQYPPQIHSIKHGKGDNKFVITDPNCWCLWELHVNISNPAFVVEKIWSQLVYAQRQYPQAYQLVNMNRNQSQITGCILWNRHAIPEIKVQGLSISFMKLGWRILLNQKHEFITMLVPCAGSWIKDI